MRHLVLLVHLMLPTWWFARARDTAIGHRTGDLVAHVWAIWSGVESWPNDPTHSDWVGWPYGTDLLAFFGGWGHTFIAVLAAVVLEIEPAVAYSIALCIWLAVCGIGAHLLAQSMGAGVIGGIVGGLLLQLDGIVLYHATEGRPEHVGIGMAALALAGAVTLWRGRGGIKVALATGVAGALCLVVGWEIGLWLAVTMAVLAPFFWWSGRGEGALRHWAIAAVTTAVLATPWVALFLTRAMAIRQTDEGIDLLSWAIDQSLPLLGWIKGMPHHPATLALVAMLFLPWTISKEDRRIWLGVGCGLVLSLVLATGPSPGLFKPGDLDPNGSLWGPYTWLQQLPVMGWFHSPGRLVIGWSLAASTAGALLVSRIAQKNRIVAIVIGAVLVGQAGWAAERHRTWPGPGLALPMWPEPRQLAAISGTEALIDMPPHFGDVWSEDARITQMMHRKPTPASGFMRHLAPDRTSEFTAISPMLLWLAQGAEGEPPLFSDAERTALLDKNLRYVAVAVRRYPPSIRKNLREHLESRFGRPVAHMGMRWMCFDLTRTVQPKPDNPDKTDEPM